MKSTVVKILRHEELVKFRDARTFDGSEDDRRDGFIHLSSLEQTAGSLGRHFSIDGVGEEGVSLLFLDPDALGDALRWESSGGGQRFPHYYDTLKWDQVRRSVMLDVDESGRHILPDWMT